MVCATHSHPNRLQVTGATRVRLQIGCSPRQTLICTRSIRPGLTEVNRTKQVEFNTHVHNRWGLADNTKVLWTMAER
jgi:hypothetical protein